MKKLDKIRNDDSVKTISQFIEDRIEKNWNTVFKSNAKKLTEAYIKAGDRAYGTYANLLFSPITKELKKAGFKSHPKLPGDLNISREWGDNETDRQRWIWSTIESVEGEKIGTIVTILYHDHTELRIPRPPEIFHLEEIKEEKIINALSRMSDEFKRSKEFKIVMKELFTK